MATAAVISWRFRAAVGAETRISLAMSKHVILLTDAHEAPAYELIEALRAAGVKTLIEGLREVEAEMALARRQESEGSVWTMGPPPLLSCMKWYQGRIWWRCKQPRITPRLSGRARRWWHAGDRGTVIKA